jgi:large subunit ribosomal protein L24
MKKIQTGDTVIVTSWKHKGAVASVIRVVEDRVYLQGVNVVKKAVKKQWFVEKEASLHVSNVSAYDPIEKKASRVKIWEEKGKKVRILVTSGKVIKK